MDRFIEHNKHWQSPEIFAEQDPHLYILKKRSLVYQPDLIYELPYVIPGIYTLSGGRQIGKTTLLKQWMKYLVLEKLFKASDIFFMTGEIISDQISLIQLVKQYMEEQESKSQFSSPVRILIIDEVNYIKNWDQGIKYLADLGTFENVVVILTGSDTSFIKEARMRFPGRRGKADNVDFHLSPLSFFEFIRLKYTNGITLSSGLLLKEFESNYLKHGGFLIAINDYEKNQKIELATYRTYSDWVRGDFLKRGKQESYLIEVLRAIIKTYGTQVTWNSLADHTSISHHDTVRLYVELLESMDVLFIQNALREDKLAAAPKTAKKIIFKDTFMYHALREWALPNHMQDNNIFPSLVESCVVSHYQRFYPCYYIKNEGEVDLAYVHEDQFFPVEVKWRKQIRTKDLKQISKYKKNGLILNQTVDDGTLNDISTRFLPTHLYNFYIRERLEQITKDGLKEIFVKEQVKIIETLLGRKSQLYELDLVGIFKPPINGFAYAFGLDRSKKYKEIAIEDARDENKPIENRFFASFAFVTYLLKENSLKEIDTPHEGCLILYFNAGIPKHAGIVKSNDLMESPYIESKWGNFQALFFHGIWDVPRSYGNKIKYYALPSWEEIEACFIRYCRIVLTHNQITQNMLTSLRIRPGVLWVVFFYNFVPFLFL
jgi:predicted AAA+ superfamily ATPase